MHQTDGGTDPVPAFLTRPAQEFGKPVCRLGLASHGITRVVVQ
jgi:hypothetical protein